MENALRSWILGVTGAAIVTAVTLTITPEGRVKRVVAVVCGFMLLTMLIRPVRSFDYGAFRQGLNILRSDANIIAENAAESNAKIERAVIEQKTAEYIADKGTLIGLEVTAAFVETASGKDGYWYPCAVTIYSDGNENLKQKLRYEIEANLGIAPEDIKWGETVES